MGVARLSSRRRPAEEQVGLTTIGMGRPLVIALFLMAIVGAAGPASNDAVSAEAVTSWAGFGGVAITEILSQRLELPSAGGVIVTFVHPEGPAAKAGIQTKDVILRADGRPITNGAAWSEWVAQQAPGTEIELGLQRQGEAIALTLMIEELPANAEVEPSTN